MNIIEVSWVIARNEPQVNDAAIAKGCFILEGLNLQ
jgi:hypothetical protein